MSCKHFRQQIPLAVGHDLGADSRRAIAAHLRSCLSCYRQYRDYESALRSFESIRSPESFPAPAGLREEIMASVRADRADRANRASTTGPAAPHPTSWWARERLLTGHALPLAAGILLMVLAGMYMSSHRDRGHRLGRRIPREVVEPVVRTLGTSPADELGPMYLFPDRLHPGRFRLVGPAPLRRTEPLPPAAVPISNRNDF